MAVAYSETPLGNALALMGRGECCSTETVLVCRVCGTVYPDDCPGEDDTGFCGPCGHEARYLYTRHPGRLLRRERRSDDRLVVTLRH